MSPRGRPSISYGSTPSLTIRVQPDVRSALELLAESQGRSLADVSRDALRAYAEGITMRDRISARAERLKDDLYLGICGNDEHLVAAQGWRDECPDCGSSAQPQRTGNVGPLTWCDPKHGCDIGAYSFQCSGCGQQVNPIEVRTVIDWDWTADDVDQIMDALLSKLDAAIDAELDSTRAEIEQRLRRELQEALAEIADLTDDEKRDWREHITNPGRDDRPGVYFDEYGQPEWVAWDYDPRGIDGEVIEVRESDLSKP